MFPLKFPFAALCLGACLLAGCESTTTGGQIGADRRQLLLVSSEQMNEMAAQAYTEMKTEAEREGALNTNARMLERIRAVGQRLRPHTQVFRADAPDWAWEVNLLESEQLNAFCMPGGKIMFYTGIIEQLELSDDEIAVVMGHEIAHALREHSREQMSQALAAQTAIGLGAAVLGVGQAGADLAATGYQALVATRFSRADESEADRMGLELTARAGYDPRAGVSLWRKMIDASQGSAPPELLSSHPAGANRIREIEALLPVVLPLYEEARR